MLVVRNDKASEATPVKVPRAVRIRPADWHIDASRLKGQLMVVY